MTDQFLENPTATPKASPDTPDPLVSSSPISPITPTSPFSPSENKESKIRQLSAEALVASILHIPAILPVISTDIKKRSKLSENIQLMQALEFALFKRNIQKISKDGGSVRDIYELMRRYCAPAEVQKTDMNKEALLQYIKTKYGQSLEAWDGLLPRTIKKPSSKRAAEPLEVSSDLDGFPNDLLDLILLWRGELAESIKEYIAFLTTAEVEKTTLQPDSERTNFTIWNEWQDQLWSNLRQIFQHAAKYMENLKNNPLASLYHPTINDIVTDTALNLLFTELTKPILVEDKKSTNPDKTAKYLGELQQWASKFKCWDKLNSKHKIALKHQIFAFKIIHNLVGHKAAPLAKNPEANKILTELSKLPLFEYVRLHLDRNVEEVLKIVNDILADAKESKTPKTGRRLSLEALLKTPAPGKKEFEAFQKAISSLRSRDTSLSEMYHEIECFLERNAEEEVTSSSEYSYRSELFKRFNFASVADVKSLSSAFAPKAKGFFELYQDDIDYEPGYPSKHSLRALRESQFIATLTRAFVEITERRSSPSLFTAAPDAATRSYEAFKEYLREAIYTESTVEIYKAIRGYLTHVKGADPYKMYLADAFAKISKIPFKEWETYLSFCVGDAKSPVSPSSPDLFEKPATDTSLQEIESIWLQIKFCKICLKVMEEKLAAAITSINFDNLWQDTESSFSSLNDFLKSFLPKDDLLENEPKELHPLTASLLEFALGGKIYKMFFSKPLPKETKEVSKSPNENDLNKLLCQYEYLDFIANGKDQPHYPHSVLAASAKRLKAFEDLSPQNSYVSETLQKIYQTKSYKNFKKVSELTPETLKNIILSFGSTKPKKSIPFFKTTKPSKLSDKPAENKTLKGLATLTLIIEKLFEKQPAPSIQEIFKVIYDEVNKKKKSENFINSNLSALLDKLGLNYLNLIYWAQPAAPSRSRLMSPPATLHENSDKGKAPLAVSPYVPTG